MFSALRAALNYAEAARLIARSPCTGVRLPQASLVDRPMLTASQLERLAGELGAGQAAMMWLGAVGGLRWSEAAGLTVAGLDLLAGKVTVAGQIRRDGTLGPAKSASGRRTLALPVWLCEDLAALLAGRGLSAGDQAALVFTSPAGGPLDYSRWRTRMWLPACERAGMPGLRFHDLRSMAATALVAAGVDVKTAQTRLGHSSPSVTLGIYARATASADRAAADAVGAFFGASRTQRARPSGTDSAS
jgi:integrase